MKRTVLIVDDEDAAREGLARVLRSRGHVVRTAADAETAIHLLATEPADIAVIDLGLPHVPGDAVASFLAIRSPKTRLIFVSGQYDMVDPERFGASAIYMRKPVDIDALLEVLESPAAAASAPPALPMP